MKLFAEKILDEMSTELKNIEDLLWDNPVEGSNAAIQILTRLLEKLKVFFTTYNCKDAEDEIYFFKKVKPQLMQQLIYYNELYYIELTKPLCSQNAVRKYYKIELQKRTQYLNENRELYKYYRMDGEYLDTTYFIRNNAHLKMNIDSLYYSTDPTFSTTHDFKFAFIMATERLQSYLNEQLLDLTVDKKQEGATQKTLTWTGSKAGLIELIYALHTAGVINNGNCEVREIVQLCIKTLNVDLGQFHRTFYEIMGRTSDRTKFLSVLQKGLLQKMEHADI